ncbi:MAG: hypothetical protein AMXMBFR47_21940 [Planctomycetota bacterium]
MEAALEPTAARQLPLFEEAGDALREHAGKSKARMVTHGNGQTAAANPAKPAAKERSTPKAKEGITTDASPEVVSTSGRVHKKAVPAAVRSKRPARRKSAQKNPAGTRSVGSRKRGRKPYPIVTFADVLPLAEGIFTHSPDQPVKRATLLSLLGKEANSEASRLLIINSGKYGLTEGGMQAEYLALTPRGKVAVNPKAGRAEHMRARFDLAIGDIPAFKALYEKRRANNMPAPAILHDDLQDLDDGDRKACADVFTSNVKYLGLLVPRDGAEYLMTVEEWIGQKPSSATADGRVSASPISDGTPAATDSTTADYDKVCFVVSTIKDADTPERTHADAILNQYIEKSLDGTGLKVVRADKIGEPGMISRQIIEYVIKSKLVVVDLSFHNPNVFYELALRHVTGKPTVQVTRACDKLPFDVGNARTIPIDTSDGYTMVREIDTIRSQIATAIRSALASGESRDNPILTYCPNVKFLAEGQ